MESFYGIVGIAFAVMFPRATVSISLWFIKILAGSVYLLLTIFFPSIKKQDSKEQSAKKHNATKEDLLKNLIRLVPETANTVKEIQAERKSKAEVNFLKSIVKDDDTKLH